LEANVLTGLNTIIPFDPLVGHRIFSDGSYIIKGLPPASDYALRLSNEVDGFEALLGTGQASANLLSQSFESASDIEDIPDDPEFDEVGSNFIDLPNGAFDFEDGFQGWTPINAQALLGTPDF